MRRNLSDQEFHAKYCPVKNPKSAMFLVAYFSVAAFDDWRGLHKPLEDPALVELLFATVVIVMLAKWLVAFTCFRERLAFGLAIVSLATSEGTRFAPIFVIQYADVVRFSKLALSVLGLMVSLTMLVPSARTQKVEPNELQASVRPQATRSFLIVLAVALTILMLGSLLYFLPLRQ